MGFYHCLYQYGCGHDHHRPCLYLKVSLLLVERRFVLLSRYYQFVQVLPICQGITNLSRYYQLKADTSSAQGFTLLKNFFTYVDDLEHHVFTKRIKKVPIS